jgi:hypothetical protein
LSAPRFVRELRDKNSGWARAVIPHLGLLGPCGIKLRNNVLNRAVYRHLSPCKSASPWRILMRCYRVVAAKYTDKCRSELRRFSPRPASPSSSWHAPLRFEHTFGRGRIPGKLFHRSPRARDELASAIGAFACELGLRACLAERAFERADSRVRAVRRQIDVAAFAVGSELKHVSSLRFRQAPRLARIALAGPLAFGRTAVGFGHLRSAARTPA